MKAAGCDAVCFAGIVTRPDFRSFVPDLEGAKLLPGLLAAAVRGDDALLRVVIKAFEAQGLRVVGADTLSDSLLATEGRIGGDADAGPHQSDIAKAMQIAAAIGVLDAGQGAVVCDGLVLALEAQEGTDAMIVTAEGLRVAISEHPASLEEDCARADLVIARGTVSQWLKRRCAVPILDDPARAELGSAEFWVRDGRITRLRGAQDASAARVWGRGT